MVKKITVIPVNENSNEEIIQQDEEIINVEEKYTVEEHNIKLEDDTIRETEEINTTEKLEDKPKSKGKKKVLNDMPTTEKVISQVQCPSCNKCMSAKSLKYSHAAYCIKRVQEDDKPEVIPVSKKNMKNLKKPESDNTQITLSEFNNMEIKRLEALKRPTYELRKKNNIEKKTREYIQPDKELYESEGEIFKGSIIPSDDIEIDPMTQLKNKITKAQEEYMIKNKKSDLPMYKPTILRPEDIEPTYEVRMKTIRQKKQEKYDKLALKAF